MLSTTAKTYNTVNIFIIVKTRLQVYSAAGLIYNIIENYPIFIIYPKVDKINIFKYFPYILKFAIKKYHNFRYLFTKTVTMTNLERLTYQYEGFKNQPNLWTDNSFFKYPQIELPFLDSIDETSIDTSKHYRLGKLVEVFYQKNLEKIPNYTSLINNLQIQIDKHQTIGELDFICKTPNGIHHIELTYKFYLYKTDLPYELDRWVGPNLKDSWIKKLEKLKNKQFQLLHHRVCKKILQEKGLQTDNIKQSVHFKAQLYIPLSLANHTFLYINNDCIKGYYISYKEIDFLFPMALYYVPLKKDWLIDPKHNRVWVSFTEAKPIILEQIAIKHSPLIWIKRGDVFERFFITFW